jgi:hypothetical protein
VKIDLNLTDTVVSSLALSHSIRSDVFKDDLSQDQLGLYATRLYLVLLTLCIVALMTYSSVEIRTNTFNVRQPSLTAFEALHMYYSTTLQCPCAQVSVPHSKIFRLSSPRLHQVRKRRSQEFHSVV